MRNFALFLIVCLTFSHSMLHAQQEAVPLDLESVLKLGGAANLTVQQYKFLQQKAIADLDVARDWFLPEIYAGAQLHQLTGTALNSDGRFFTDVDRESFWAGVGLNMSWDFAEGVFQTKARRLNAEASRYQSQAERNEVLLEIIATYYDLLVADLRIKTYEDLIKQADTISQQIKIQVEAGIQYESELLLALSNKGQLEVENFNTRIVFAAISAKMQEQLNLPIGTTFNLQGRDLLPLALVSADQLESNDSLYKIQPAYIAGEKSLQAISSERKTSTTALLLPNLKVNAYTSQFGDVFSPTDPTSAINAGLMWRIPLGRVFYSGEPKRFDADIALQKNYLAMTKARFASDMTKSTSTLSLYKQQMDIAKDARESAEQAMQQARQRQNLGLMRPYELLQTQDLLLKSWLSYYTVVANYNKAQYKYYVLQGNNL